MTFVAMFIGSVYQNQDQIKTQNEQHAIWITNLLFYLFEEYRNLAEIQYVEVVNKKMQMPLLFISASIGYMSYMDRKENKRDV